MHVAASFLAAVKCTPYRALPVIGKKTGIILEYPAAIPGVSTDANHVPSSGMFISEDVDPGHRHFSSMHWLYPGLFLPHVEGAVYALTMDFCPISRSHAEVILCVFDPGNMTKYDSPSASAIYEAAFKSVKKKVDSGSGHTAWSAAWLSCLWARLGVGDSAWQPLAKMIDRYSSPNLMSLHPPMSAGSTTIPTIFNEERNSPNRRVAASSRGLKTMDKSPVVTLKIIIYARLCNDIL